MSLSDVISYLSSPTFCTPHFVSFSLLQRTGVIFPPIRTVFFFLCIHECDTLLEISENFSLTSEGSRTGRYVGCMLLAYIMPQQHHHLLLSAALCIVSFRASPFNTPAHTTQAVTLLPCLSEMSSPLPTLTACGSLVSTLNTTAVADRYPKLVMNQFILYIPELAGKPHWAGTSNSLHE